MSQTPPPTIAPAPAPVQRGDRSTFATRLDAFVLWLTGAVSAFGAVASNVYANALDAYDNAVAAATAAGAASAAATTATQTAGATMWVSGTTYAVGDNRISPVNFQTYRRKTAGAGTTDPSNDGTNWARVGALTPTSANTTSGATDVTLTNASAGLQAIAMSAPGRSVWLPSALMLSLGGPLFVIRNSGSYPFGVRDNTGTLLVAVAPGGSAYLSLEGQATAAGAWGIAGAGLEPGLITLDQTLSTTYGANMYAVNVAFDANTSLHFAALATNGFAAFLVDNAGKVISTPVTVTATAGKLPCAAFRVSATSAIVFYGASGGTNDSAAVVISINGASPSLSLSVGTPVVSSFTGWAGAWGGEDSNGAPKIAQLSGTSYVASVTNGGNGTNAVAISVTGMTVSIGNATLISSTAPGSSNSSITYTLTATTALVLFTTQPGNYQLNTVVVSVSGTTCTIGSIVAVGPQAASTVLPPYAALLSPTKAVVAFQPSGQTYLAATAITVAGTVVTAGTTLTFDTGLGGESYSSHATRYNPHLFPLSTTSALLWYTGGASISRALVLTESGGILTAGPIFYGGFASAGGNGVDGYGAVSTLGSTADFIGIVQNGVAGSWRKIVVPHKINGTTITCGTGQAVPELSPTNSADSIACARLSQGDYLLLTPSANAMPVLRSNGDMMTRRGAVSLPNLGGPTISSVIATPAANRMLMAVPTNGSTSQNQQLHILNIEVAA